MNTRIQVEHPITEEICGVDLIRGMLLVAQGDPLPYRQEDVAVRGHAIEVRVNAEDPERNFMPAPGTIEALRWAQGPGVRVDSMAYAGYTIPPYYDSLIGKLIVWAEDRELALARLGRALRRDPAGRPEDHVAVLREAAGVRGRPIQRVPHDLARDLVRGRSLMTSTRYTLGGDEHLFVELSESMQLDAFFRSILITQELAARDARRRHRDLPGQRLLPGPLRPRRARGRADSRAAPGHRGQPRRDRRAADTRIVEIPVLYNDPWTHETLMRFRERHQDPDSTDLEYAARINGYPDIDAFIEAHSGTPWFVTMVGFVAGTALHVPDGRAGPTDPGPQVPQAADRHPEAHGRVRRLLLCIYSVRGAGGYQMFGVTPVPIYDPDQKTGTSRTS